MLQLQPSATNATRGFEDSENVKGIVVLQKHKNKGGGVSRDMARRRTRADEKRDALLQRRRERLAAEGTEQRKARVQQMSHSQRERRAAESLVLSAVRTTQNC